MADQEPKGQAILVVGGGVAGLTTAVEAAEVGYQVILLEKNPYLGGRVAQLHRYFPKLCPPACGLEINFKRIRQNPKIRYYTMAEVQSISGSEGNFECDVKLHPRYVNEKCTCCGECGKACDTEIPNAFNYGMDTTKAVHLPYEGAFPRRYVIAPEVLGTPAAQKIADACKYDAVDLSMEPKNITLKVSSIVWATGWKPFEAEKIDYYGFGESKNVISNVMMERLASPDGPTGGKLLRPSDGKAVENVAFVQCAGSRDENYLPYCSGICCLASMKQATYVREQNPNAKATIYFIDVRAPDRLEHFYNKLLDDENISFVKAKIAQITEHPETGELTFQGENTLTGERFEAKADLVVLATGMVPNTADTKIPVDMKYDDYGFVSTGKPTPGVHPAGTIVHPWDVSSSVQDGTAAALKAIQSSVRG